MERRDRGQLFVLAALALAVMVIGVALLLNSGVYSANLAAQNADAGVEEPRTFLREAELGANRVMAYSNYNNFTTYDALRRNFSVGLHNWSERAHHHRALGGTGVEVGEINVTNGSRITQDTDSRQFLNASRARTNWTLGTELEGVRQFRMNVTHGSLANTTPGLTTATEYRNSDYFRINVSDVSTTPPARTWRIYIYRNDVSPNRILLRVENSSGDLSPPCSTRVNANGRATLYLTDGLIGRDHCEQLTFLDSPPTPFAINYTNGDSIEGSYELFVNRRYSSLNDSDYFAGTHPTLERAIYSATVDVNYTSSSARLTGNRSATPDRRRFIGSGDPFSIPVGQDIAFQNESNDRLTTINNSGVTVDYVAGGSLESVGPFALDLDSSDSLWEFPFGRSNKVLIADKNGNEDQISGGGTSPRDDTTLAIGRNWQGTDHSVFYAVDVTSGPMPRRDELRRANHIGGQSDNLVVEANGDGILAVAGIADIDADSADELVYLDENRDIRYVDDDGSTIGNFNNGPPSSSQSPGIGTPADFDKNGKARVPIVNSSGNIALVDKDNGITPITTTAGGVAEQSPIASQDWDDDGVLEIIFISNSASNNNLHVLDDVTSGSPTITTITNEAGDPVEANPDVGVR
jgi:hypothetical protein